MESKSNVLYFCNAGKDRTGVVSAILLHKSGKDISYIVDDYMKSKSNLKNMLESFVRQNPSINIDVITPNERYINEFIEWFISNENKKTLITKLIQPSGLIKNLILKEIAF